MTRTSWWALALVAVLFSGLAEAQAPIGRRKHAAILLRDGTVLVAGGSDNSNSHSSVVERFVPWSGWDAGQALSVVGGMGNPAAALLPDGRVLFVDQGARLYTPDTNSWEELALNFPQSRRGEHTLTVLHDGRVLLAGGIDYGSAPDAGYPLIGQPSGDGGWRWKEVDAGEIGFALRKGHTSVLLGDGGVLLIGGVLPHDPATPGPPYVGQFDAPTDRIRDGGYALPTTRTLATATRRLNGEIFVFGDFVDANASPLLFGTTPGLFTVQPLGRSGGSMKTGHQAVLYPNGDLEVLGGSNSGAPLKLVWYYPFVDGGSVTTTDPMQTGRADHTATLLMNGKLLIVGGQALNDALTWEIRDSIGFDFAPLSDSVGRALATVTPIPTGGFIVVGGESSIDGQAVSRISTTGVQSSVTLPVPGRIGHTATLLTSDEVLILGGRSQSGRGVLDDCWLISVVNPSGSPKRCPSMLGHRENHTATLLRDGKVLVAGGNDELDAPSNKTMIFDPRANGGTWQWSTDLNQPRTRHAAVMEPSGRVMLIGGGVAAVSTDWFELDAGMSIGPSLNVSRRAHTATLLRDGRILVAGGAGTGNDGGALNSVEVYDPRVDIWLPLNSGPGQTMSEARALHSAVAMPTGDVVLAGGSAGPAAGGTADRWSPLSSSFDVSSSIGTPRKAPAVVLGNRGEVLVVGGGRATGEKVMAFRHFLDPSQGGLGHALSAVTVELQNGKPFVLKLSGEWRNASEASSGNTQNSSVSMPRLLLQRLDNGEVVVPSYVFDPVSGEITINATRLAEGYWRAWAYVSAFPGNAAWFRVGDAGTLAWDAGLPDAGTDGGQGSDGGAIDGGTDAGTGSDGGTAQGVSVSVTLDTATPHYTLVKVPTVVKVSATPGSAGLTLVVSGSADLAVCNDTDCQVGNVFTVDLPGTVGPTGYPVSLEVRPMRDGPSHIVTATVLSKTNGSNLASAQAGFESVPLTDKDLAPGGCGCNQTPFSLLALWAIAWALRKARPKARQRL